MMRRPNILLIVGDEERARIPRPRATTYRPGNAWPRTRNLAADPDNGELVETYRGRLEALIGVEIGPDARAWVTERPCLLGWPTWHGDTDQLVGAGAATA